MEQLVTFPQRKGTRLVDVHAADGIANQTACSRWSRNPFRGIRGLRRMSGLLPKHSTDDAAQEPYAPGKDEEPK